jgi:hypothetical protein
MGILKADSNIVVPKLYNFIKPLITKNDSKFRSNIARFINDRHELLFALAPYDRIYFNQSDIDNMFKALGTTEAEVKAIIRDCFFYDIPYNPQCAKEPYVLVLFCIIRYYIKMNKLNYAQLVTVYLAFSGKFYASLHGEFWNKVPPSKYPTVMDYVINNMLSQKFDLKKEGTVYGAVKAMSVTWVDTYSKNIKSDTITDDDIGGLIQQLRDREKSFLKNIANAYYEAFENRNYLNYETDDLSDDNFRLTDNDSAKAARITDNTLNNMTSNYVSMEVANKCKDSNVKATEIKDIMESIVSDKQNIPDLRRVINIYVCDFLRNYPRGDIGSVEFVSYSMKLKPNSKDKYIIDCKNIILSWLDENSPNYRRRKSRTATQNSYYRAIALYIILTINRNARK